MAVLTVSDFNSKFATARNEYTSSNVTEYISRYEDYYLVHLLGKELYDIFIVSYDDNLSPDYTRSVALYNAFIEQYSGGIFQSQGIKDMLMGFVYFHYQRDIYTQPTTSGNVKNASQNSTSSGFVQNMMFQKYNESIDSYYAIQRYIIENSATYPEYDGVNIGGYCLPL